MRQLKFIHFGDLHMDSPFTSLGGSDKARARRQELKACFSRIVSLAAEEKSDLLLICGDLYEHRYTGKTTLHFIADELRRIPSTRVVIIPGNHDPWSGNSWYRTYPWPENVDILNETNPRRVFEDLGVCVWSQSAIPGLNPGETGEIKGLGRNEVFKFDKNYFNILMLHATLDMGFGKNVWNPVESGFLDCLEMDYVALGHFHSNLQEGGKRGCIYNPGSPEPLGFDEKGEHGVLIGTLTENKDRERCRSVRRLPVHCRSFRTLEVPVDGCNTPEQVRERTLEAMRAAGGSEDLFEIRLKGYTPEDLAIDAANLAEGISAAAFFVKVVDETLWEYDFASLAKEPGIRGLFTRKMLQRMENAASPKERQLAGRGLVFGLQALDHGRPDMGG